MLGGEATLCAGHFGRSFPLSVSAFPRVYCPDSPKAFERHNNRTNSMCRQGQPSWTATLKTVFCCAFGCSKYDKHRKNGMRFHWFPRNEEFRRRRRLLGGCSSTSIAARKLRKFVEKKYKQWWMNDPSTEQRSAVVKTRWDILEGAWSCPQSLSTPSRTRRWMKMLANIGNSSATAVDLRAILRRWANCLHHVLDIIKTTDTVLSSIPHDALSTLTPECVPHWRSRRTKVQVWIAFGFTGLSFSSSCICFIHRIVLRFLS